MDQLSAALSLEVVESSIGVLTLDQPGSRANTLGQAILGELESAIEKLQGRSDLQGLIFRSGKPGMFIAGADLKELGSASHDPANTRKLVQRGLGLIASFEQLSYPTVALIDGACVGGGLELALGFDHRLAGSHPKVDIGLPEVKVGLIPGWGGTQRLSRIIGPALAGELICAGETVKSARASELGIVFDVVPSDKLLEEGIRLLQWSLESGDWKEQRRRKQQPVGLNEEQKSFTFAVLQGQVAMKTGGNFPAPLAAVEAIAGGCNLPLEEGLAVETEKFAPLVGSPVSRNLIGMFFMNQRLAKDPGVENASVKPREVNLVGVVGAGLMGAGIATAHVRRGIPTTMLDNAADALERGVGAVGKSLQGRVGIGRMTMEEAAGALGRLSTSMSIEALGDRDVVIEAIVENEQVKSDLFGRLQKVVKEGAILASNTSTISITRMAKSVERPERFAGMHFFNPVDRMQLVEVIRGEKTDDETVVTLVALAKRIGKVPIVVRDCPGFLVNRILFPYMNEALLMLEEGASPRQLDKVATGFGMPMGPITLQDVVGLDTSLFAGKVIAEAFPDRSILPKILGELVSAGRKGKKSGAGFYSYAKGSRGADDPDFVAILDKTRSGKRDLSEEEIVDRLFLPMLTEASRVLTENIVREPADVDMGLVLGIGFPTFRGGLLRWADDLGLAKVLEKLAKYESLGARFAPTEQMRELAAVEKGFYE